MVMSRLIFILSVDDLEFVKPVVAVSQCTLTSPLALSSPLSRTKRHGLELCKPVAAVIQCDFTAALALSSPLSRSNGQM